MNRSFTKILSVVALLGLTAGLRAATCDTDCPTLKCYKRRSDSRHKYIQVAGSMDKAHLGDAESMYGVFTFTPGYRGSFKPTRIAKCLFGDDLGGTDNCCDNRTIKIEGSAVKNRDAKAWLADYFYLPRNYQGTFSVEPRIKTFFLDLDLFVGLDEWLCGLYFRLWGDVVHSSWNLDFCDRPGLDSDTALDHPHGYFSPAQYEGEKLVQTFGEYARGATPDPSTAAGYPVSAPAGNSAVTIVTGGVANDSLTFQALRYAKMLKCSRSETGFADLRFELGWDFWQSECYHLGLNIQFAAPTGQKKEPCFLFDAMVGNGNHWELGGGVTGHYVFWRSEDSESHFSFHLDANLTHMFKERHQRTFDLRNKPNSAYMLAAKFGENTTTPPDQIASPLTTDTATTTKQFTGEYAPVANLSTTSVDVSIGVQADIVAMINYTCGGFSWDLGYNFWGHGCEKMECPDNCKNSLSLCNTANANTWALKGDARMFGSHPSDGRVVPIAATQDGADIHSGLNNYSTLITPMAQFNKTTGATENNVLDINPRIDDPRDVFLAGIAQLTNITGGTNINSSNTPVFLSCDSIDFTRIKATSHTVFTNLSYTWDRECWVPFLGVGFAAEFANQGSCCDDDISKTSSTGVACGPCVNCAVSQWSIWLQGGMSFN